MGCDGDVKEGGSTVESGKSTGARMAFAQYWEVARFGALFQVT